MTWVFDQIQTFLEHIKKVDDPTLFETAIQYVSRIIASIHDIDHSLDQRIAKALDVTQAMKRIREFNKEVEA